MFGFHEVNIFYLFQPNTKSSKVKTYLTESYVISKINSFNNYFDRAQTQACCQTK